MLNFLKNHWLKIIAIALLFLVLFLFKQNSDLKYAAQKHNQNYAALLDTLRIEKNKNNQNVYVRSVYAAEISELKKLNQALAKELEKEKGKYKVYTKIEQKVETIKEPVFVETNLTLQDTTFIFSWNYDYSELDFRQLISARTLFQIDTNDNSLTGNFLQKLRFKNIRTELLKSDIYLTIYTGIRETDNGLYEVTVRSNYPNIQFNPIGVIDPKLFFKEQKIKRFGLGFVAGIGGAGYLNRLQFVDGITYFVGIGISYNLFNF